MQTRFDEAKLGEMIFPLCQPNQVSAPWSLKRNNQIEYDRQLLKGIQNRSLLSEKIGKENLMSKNISNTVFMN